jgi:hypothetical protein
MRRTIGVSSRQTVSLTKRAERDSGNRDDAPEESRSAARTPGDPRRHGLEESREVQVSAEDHHAKQEDDGVAVDRGVCLP